MVNIILRIFTNMVFGIWYGRCDSVFIKTNNILNESIYSPRNDYWSFAILIQSSFLITVFEEIWNHPIYWYLKQEIMHCQVQFWIYEKYLNYIFINDFEVIGCDLEEVTEHYQHVPYSLWYLFIFVEIFGLPRWKAERYPLEWQR